MADADWRPVLTIYWPEQFWFAVLLMFGLVKFCVPDPLQDWLAAALIGSAAFYQED